MVIKESPPLWIDHVTMATKVSQCRKIPDESVLKKPQKFKKSIVWAGESKRSGNFWIEINPTQEEDRRVHIEEDESGFLVPCKAGLAIRPLLAINTVWKSPWFHHPVQPSDAPAHWRRYKSRSHKSCLSSRFPAKFPVSWLDSDNQGRLSPRSTSDRLRDAPPAAGSRRIIYKSTGSIERVNRRSVRRVRRKKLKKKNETKKAAWRQHRSPPRDDSPAPVAPPAQSRPGSKRRTFPVLDFLFGSSCQMPIWERNSIGLTNAVWFQCFAQCVQSPSVPMCSL